MKRHYRITGTVPIPATVYLLSVDDNDGGRDVSLVVGHVHRVPLLLAESRCLRERKSVIDRLIEATVPPKLSISKAISKQ